MTVKYWSGLSLDDRRRCLLRPRISDASDVRANVARIIKQVQTDKDAALFELTQQYDEVGLKSLEVDPLEIRQAFDQVSVTAVEALNRAIRNVRLFHEQQRAAPIVVETDTGVRCELVTRPLKTVGLYVPAGSAPLPSAVIMSAVPAAVANVPERIVCTPPMRDGHAHPAIVVAATLAGVTRIFKAGGAQAIAAMAYGTPTIPKVDKIFGPGNRYVTEAKLQVAQDGCGVAIDLPAGPSEVMVVADSTANPAWVAADLLAQAEHDPTSQVILVALSAQLAHEVVIQVSTQLSTLSRQSICRQALANSQIVVVEDQTSALGIIEEYAPEHLILSVEQPRQWLDFIGTAGSVFLGSYTPESLGDYCSGTNHVLPTYGYARSYSGLTLKDFTRTMTVQEATYEGLKNLGPTAIVLAELEGLDAHARAVSMRLEQGG